MDILNNLQWYLYAIPSLVIASTVHEYAHAFAATKLGDYTAKAEGRLSLNPLSHIDPIGALLMIFVGFGWSKPVPINEYNFDKPVLFTAITAAAGPISNFILILISLLIFQIFPIFPLIVFMIVNISLAVFNLIPIPPLDGHKIVRAILPNSIRYYWEKLEKFAPIILIFFLLPFSPLSTFTSSLISGVINKLLFVLGIS